MFDLFNEILQTLRNSKTRTVLTGLSVAWGIFMLIVLLGMGNGVVNAFEANMMQTSNRKITVMPGYTTKPYHGYREGREIQLKEGDLDKVNHNNKSFTKDVSASMNVSGGTLTSPRGSYTASARGVYPAHIDTETNMRMTQGRFISQKDMNDNAKVMVIPDAVATQLFPPDGSDALGSRVTYSNLSFVVVGVYEARWRRQVYIPYSTAKMLTGNSDNIDNITVLLQNVETEEDGNSAEQSLKKTLATAHDFAPDDDGAVWVWNQFNDGLRGQKAMNILTVSLWVLGLLTLLSGVVGISNIMFVSVKERTHEIGIRRAIGARPRSILVQVIAESVAITTLFGYIGIVFGTLVTELLKTGIGDQAILLNPGVDLALAIEVTVVLVVAGALAGLFPALKAVKVKPVEALRDE